MFKLIYISFSTIFKMIVITLIKLEVKLQENFSANFLLCQVFCEKLLISAKISVRSKLFQVPSGPPGDFIPVMSYSINDNSWTTVTLIIKSSDKFNLTVTNYFSPSTLLSHGYPTHHVYWYFKLMFENLYLFIYIILYLLCIFSSKSATSHSG